jgi:CRISPR system Cascade subunit CasC
MIQNFAPSNLNRDDTINPKDCEFGGVRRARISSQCIKRAVRNEPVFSKITQLPSGERTRWLAAEISKELAKQGKDEKQSQEKATAFISALLGGMDSGNAQRSKVLFYIGDEEKKHIVEAIIKNWDSIEENIYEDLVKEYKKIFAKRSSAPDIALFGRMLADDPKLNIDAACQVAHAISTHRVNMEVDFYTAVDDLLDEDQSGAGMMGITGFNSACFYRYANIHWEQLVDNLGGDKALAKRTVEAFIRASIAAVPTGKQNSFAAHNPPSFVMVVVREDGANWSLANAFEKPVHAGSKTSLSEVSIIAIDNYWGNLKRVFGGDQKIAVLMLDDGLKLENLAEFKVADSEVLIQTALTLIAQV